MNTLHTLDIEQAQTRLEKYFDNFRQQKIRGVNFDLMPKKSDVPLIKRVSFNDEQDIFEIMFQNESKINLKHQDDVIFIENTQGSLIGMQILNVKKKGIKNIKFEILFSELDNVIQGARVGYQVEDLSGREVAKLDIEKRKIDFMKDVIKEDLVRLIDK